MELNFTKMQAAGNDYIYLDCRAAGLPPNAAALAVALSRRHFSVGPMGSFLSVPRCWRTATPRCGCSTPTAARGPCAATVYAV